MPDSTRLFELITNVAERLPQAPSLTVQRITVTYSDLAEQVGACASGLIALGLGRGERVGVYLEKRVETVVASFGATMAGGVFVPLNPLLKPEQVGYILRDCDVRVLVTSAERLPLLTAEIESSPSVRCVVVLGSAAPSAGRCESLNWNALLDGPARPGHRVIDTDMLSILYTSGSTGRPKGVVLSHRNMVAGAKSVASYLENRPGDTLLAALPLSFDAGFSQLTTAFHAGARVVLLNYLMPRDVLKAMERENVTGLTAVPPLYLHLTTLDWPAVPHVSR